MTIHSNTWEIFQETPGTLIDHAVFNEDLNYFKYMFSQLSVSEQELSQLLINVCSKGNLEIIQFVIDQLPENTNSSPGVEAAIKSNHVDVLDYFLKHGYPCPQNTITLALFSGNNEMIDCLRKYKVI